MGLGIDPGQEARLMAAVDLVGRTGARSFEIGYLHDDPARPDWYAHAQYQGARITAEGQAGPVQAAEALAGRLLSGGVCQGCGGTVQLDGVPLPPGDPVLLNHPGVTHAPVPGRVCKWRCEDDRRWVNGCGR